MTKEEFIEKYGDVEVIFSSYYKFTFTYKSILEDGSIVFVDFGATSEEIYRHEVTSTGVRTIKSLSPYAGSVYKDGIKVESFYDY